MRISLAKRPSGRECGNPDAGRLPGSNLEGAVTSRKHYRYSDSCSNRHCRDAQHCLRATTVWVVHQCRASKMTLKKSVLPTIYFMNSHMRRGTF